MKVEIKPQETAIITVDMQKDFQTIKPLADKTNERNVISNIKKIIEVSKKVNIPVFYVRTVRRKDGADSVQAVTDESLKGHKRPPLLVEGTPGSEILDELKPESDDYIITKRRLNAFYNTDLELLLRSKGVKTIILTGLITNNCIDATLKGARERDFNVIIPLDTTATMDDTVQAFYEKNVFPRASVTMNTDELIKALD
jgi:nicotinamidase-related amidase